MNAVDERNRFTTLFFPVFLMPIRICRAAMASQYRLSSIVTSPNSQVVTTGAAPRVPRSAVAGAGGPSAARPGSLREAQRRRKFVYATTTAKSSSSSAAVPDSDLRHLTAAATTALE